MVPGITVDYNYRKSREVSINKCYYLHHLENNFAAFSSKGYRSWNGMTLEMSVEIKQDLAICTLISAQENTYCAVTRKCYLRPTVPLQ